MAGKDNAAAMAAHVFREFSWTLAGVLAGAKQRPQPRPRTGKPRGRR